MILAISYVVAVVSVTVFLVQSAHINIFLVMLIPLGLALSMYLWLCLLAWPHRFRHDTVSSACANQNENFMRVILVLLTALLAVSMTALLTDEYESRGRNRRDDAYLITEIIACLMLPLTGLFPTVRLPASLLPLEAWGHVNVGTLEHPVAVHGLFSWVMHFLGIIPFFFVLPAVNLSYAHARPESWVLTMAYGAVLNLLVFIVVQSLIQLKKMDRLPSQLARVPYDTLFLCSVVSEALLMVNVSLTTFLFSMKRNESMPFEGRLDEVVAEHAALLLGAAKRLFGH